MTKELVSIDVWTVIFQWVNLFILMAIIKKVLLARVRDILDRRGAEVGAIYSSAKKAATAAENLKTKYEKQLSTATLQAEDIVSEAHNRATRQSEELLAEAKARVQQMEQRATEEIALERKKALAEAKTEISDMAVSIAAKVIDREVKAQDHEKLISDFINSVGDAI